MTSVKYECDAKNLTGTLVGSKTLFTENLTNGALVTPTPDWERRCTVTQRSLAAGRSLLRMGPWYGLRACLRWLRMVCVDIRALWSPGVSLRWRHNGRDSVFNHQPHNCLLNRLFRRRSKKTSKLRVTGLCVGNSPGTGEFPAQMASNAENVSIWWRHHVCNSSCGWSPLIP